MINMQKENMSDFNENLKDASKLTQNLDSDMSNEIDKIIDQQKDGNIKNLLDEIARDKNKNSMIDKSNETQKD